MITLKTLSKATEQEIFDQVAEHLLKQKQKSEVLGVTGISHGCRYKTDEGLKCAAGCLIDDDEYSFEDMEGFDWKQLQEKRIVPLDHSFLIHNLQLIHDQYKVDEWKMKLEQVANMYDLECNF